MCRIDLKRSAVSPQTHTSFLLGGSKASYQISSCPLTYWTLVCVASFATPLQPNPCFVFSILSCMLAHEHPQEDLVTFGYRSALEVKIYENPVISSVGQFSHFFFFLVKSPIPILTVIFKISFSIKRRKKIREPLMFSGFWKFYSNDFQSCRFLIK